MADGIDPFAQSEEGIDPFASTTSPTRAEGVDPFAVSKEEESNDFVDGIKHLGRAVAAIPHNLAQITTIIPSFIGTIAGSAAGLVLPIEGEGRLESGKILGEELGNVIAYRGYGEFGKKVVQDKNNPITIAMGGLASAAKWIGENISDAATYSGASTEIAAIPGAVADVAAQLFIPFHGAKVIGKLAAWDTRTPLPKSSAETLTDAITTPTKEWVPPADIGGVPVVLGKVLDAEGKQRVNSKGEPVAATHRRNEDGTSNSIIIDKEVIDSSFESKPWTKPTMEGVEPLPANAFPSADAYAQFLLNHEEAHTNLSFVEYKKNSEIKLAEQPQGELFKVIDEFKIPEETLRAEYEQQMNTMALEQLRENPLHSAPDPMVPPTPKTPQEVVDSLWNLTTNKKHDTAIAEQLIKSAEEAGLTPEMKENIRAFVEEGKPLSPIEQTHYDVFYKRLNGELSALLEHAQKEGIADKSLEGGEKFPRRIAPPDEASLKEMKEAGLFTDKGSLWQQAIDMVGKIGEGEKGGFDQNISKKASAATGRTLFVIELPSGIRKVVQVKGNEVIQWTRTRSGKKSFSKFIDLPKEEGRSPAERLSKAMKANGERAVGVPFYNFKEGTVAEIEHSSPYKYVKDSHAVLLDKVIEMRAQVRANEYLKNFIGSPYFKENSFKLETGKPIPEGMKIPENIDKVPALSGYALDSRTAAIITDFSKTYDPTMLNNLSGILIKNMMLNPIPHIFNEGIHVVGARGLSGWVSPAGIIRFVQTAPKAIIDTVTQSPDFLAVAKEGGSLLSLDVRNSALSDALFSKGMKEYSMTMGFKNLAKKLGRSPLDLYNGISKFSTKAMWVVRDTMYMQLKAETHMLHPEMTAKEAIAKVERHMPSYRLPTHIGGNGPMARGISKMLQNPNVSVFSNYHHGFVSSILNGIRDVSQIRKGKEGIQRFKEGADYMAALAVAYAVMYPMLDVAAQWVTGEQHAEIRRAGPLHLIHAIQEVSDGTKEPMSIISSMFTFNPALLGLVQLGADRKLYNWRPIYNLSDSPDVIAEDVADYVVNQIPQVSSSIKSNDEKLGGGWNQWLAQQVDIKANTEAKNKQLEKFRRREEAAALNRKIKARMENR